MKQESNNESLSYGFGALVKSEEGRDSPYVGHPKDMPHPCQNSENLSLISICHIPCWLSVASPLVWGTFSISVFAASFAWERVSEAMARPFSISNSFSIVWKAQRMKETLRTASPTEIQKNLRHSYPWACIIWLIRGEKNAPTPMTWLAVSNHGYCKLAVCAVQKRDANKTRICRPVNVTEWLNVNISYVKVIRTCICAVEKRCQ